MNILVTGGAGFIGSHVVDALIAQNHNVVVIDNLATGSETNLNPKATFIFRQVNDSVLEDIFDQYKFDYVFHLAAQINLRRSILYPQEDAATNILGSINVFENCIRSKVKRVIFSSTGGAMYASTAQFRNSDLLPFSEASEAKPESPYGLSKLTAENYLHLLGKLHGLQSTILRYSNVYGPRQNSKGEAGVISIFIENALQGKELTIFGDGNQTRDFIYVDDVVTANMLAMNSELDGIYNVSSNTQYSVNEIARAVQTLTGVNCTIVKKPAIAGEMLHTRLLSDKLQQHGWKPTWDLYDGMKVTVDYFK